MVFRLTSMLDRNYGQNWSTNVFKIVKGKNRGLTVYEIAKQSSPIYISVHLRSKESSLYSCAVPGVISVPLKSCSELLGAARC